MRRRRLVAALVAVALLGIGVSGCGGTSTTDGSTGGDDLTVYASLPLNGPTRDQSLAILRGAQLALQDRKGRVGRYHVRLVRLNDATAKAGGADPGQVSQNAREAARDRETIAYLGELDAMATAISLPILNEAGILQVSPASTAIGLTSSAPGAEKGEPDKYYPTSKRTFGRVVPNDTVQARTLVALMRGQHCAALSIFDDRSVYGAGLSTAVQAAARRGGPEVALAHTVDPEATEFSGAAERQRTAGTDCILYAGEAGPDAVGLVSAVAAASPHARLFAAGGLGDGVIDATFVDPARGGLPPAVARRMLVTAVPLALRDYPARAREVLRSTGEEDTIVGRSALYGYAAMAQILDAISNAGSKGNHPKDVFEAYFAHPVHLRSVLGSSTTNRNGDTSITRYGVYAIRHGQLVFRRTVDASASS